MTDLKIPQFNYDDFYKFLTSLSIVTFIAGSILTSYGIMYFPSGSMAWVFNTVIFVYFVITIASVVAFFWAMKRWREKQKLIDREQELRLGRSAIKYWKEIDELSENETFSIWDTPKIPLTLDNLRDPKELLRKKTEKKIEEVIKK